MQGRYVPSLLAAIGDIIERHMIDIGFLPRHGEAGGSGIEEEHKVVGLDDGPRMRQCPKCGQSALLRQEGDTCTACDFSKCG